MRGFSSYLAETRRVRNAVRLDGSYPRTRTRRGAGGGDEGAARAAGGRGRLATTVDPEHESRCVRMGLRSWWGSHQRASLETKGRARTGLQGEAARGGNGGREEKNRTKGIGAASVHSKGWGRCVEGAARQGEGGGRLLGGVKACKAAGLEPVTCPSRRGDHGSGSADGEAGRASKSRTDLRQAGAMHVRVVVRGARCAGWCQGWRGGARDAPGP